MFRRCRDGTREPNRALLVTLLATILEPVAWLTRWYLRDASRACSRRPQKDGCTPIVRLVFAEIFLCHTGILFDDLQRHGRHGSDCGGVGTVSGSNGWTSANPRVSRGGPQTMCCGNFVAVRVRVPSIANVHLGFLQFALILDSRTLGKGTPACSSSVPHHRNCMLLFLSACAVS